MVVVRGRIVPRAGILTIAHADEHLVFAGDYQEIDDCLPTAEGSSCGRLLAT